LRGVAEANWSMRFLVSLGTSSAISEVGTRLPRSARNDKRVFKNVVRGFSLVHDPEGSHYGNFGGEDS